ncbi:hypothetical protein [Nocardia sp. NBC_00403]
MTLLRSDPSRDTLDRLYDYDTDSDRITADPVAHIFEPKPA